MAYRYENIGTGRDQVGCVLVNFWLQFNLCGSRMNYYGSGSSSEFSEFQAKVPDPCGSGSNLS